MTILAWLLTYAFHSTLFLGAAVLLARSFPFGTEAREVLWRAALLGGLATATFQTGVATSPLTWDIGAQTAVSAPATPIIEESRTTVFLDDSRDVVVAAAPLARDTSETPPAGDNSPVGLAIAIWGAIALALLGRRAIQRRRFFRSLGTRAPVDAPRARAILADLEVRSGVRHVRLTMSSALASPVALRANEICVPRRALERFDETELRALIAHELAHLSRRDPWWLMLVSAVESLFFFQPLNRIAAAELRVTAEEACDAASVRWTGEGQALARCLLEVAAWVRGPVPASVPGIAERRSGLETRIKRLVAAAAPPDRLIGQRRAAVAVCALVLVIACGGPSVQSGREADAGPVVEAEPGESVDADASRIESPPLIGARPDIAPAPGVEPRAQDEPRVRARKRVVVRPGEEIEKTIERLEEVLDDIDIDVDVDFDDDRLAFDFRLPDDELLRNVGPGFVKVEIDGDAKIEDGAIASMGPGSRIEIEDRRGDVEKRLVITPDASGEPTYAYTEDGDPRPFDDDVRAWMKSMLGKRVFTGDGDYATFRFDIDDRHARAIRRHREVLRDRLGSVEENRAALREGIEALEREVQRLRERLRDLDETG